MSSTSTPSSADDISDDDVLYRRFLKTKRKRIVPLTAFTLPKSQVPDPEISVGLARLTTPEAMLSVVPPIFRIGMLRVRDVRALGFVVDPDPKDDDPAHCVIRGALTMDHCDQLAEITEIYQQTSGETQGPDPVRESAAQ